MRPHRSSSYIVRQEEQPERASVTPLPDVVRVVRRSRRAPITEERLVAAVRKLRNHADRIEREAGANAPLLGVWASQEDTALALLRFVRAWGLAERGIRTRPDRFAGRRIS